MLYMQMNQCEHYITGGIIIKESLALDETQIWWLYKFYLLRWYSCCLKKLENVAFIRAIRHSTLLSNVQMCSKQCHGSFLFILLRYPPRLNSWPNNQINIKRWCHNNASVLTQSKWFSLTQVQSYGVNLGKINASLKRSAKLLLTN